MKQFREPGGREWLARQKPGIIEQIRAIQEERRAEVDKPVEISKEAVEEAALGLGIGFETTYEALDRIYARLNTDQFRKAGRSGVMWTLTQKPAILTQIGVIQQERQAEIENKASSTASTQPPVEDPVEDPAPKPAPGEDISYNEPSRVTGVAKFFNTAKESPGIYNPDDSQDSVNFDEATGRYALADGVSKSLMPKEFSRALANKFVREPIGDAALTPVQVQDWNNWLDSIRSAWRDWMQGEMQKKQMPFWITNAFTHGDWGSSTFIGLQFSENNQWQAHVLGDSALFVIRNGQIAESHGDRFNTAAPGQVNANPNHSVNKTPPNILTGDVQSGDVFLITSDALGDWLESYNKAGRINEALTLLESIQTEQDYQSFIEKVENDTDIALQHDDQSFIWIDGEQAVNAVQSTQTKTQPEEEASEEEASEADESMTPAEKRVRESGGIPEPTFAEEMDAGNSILVHEDTELGWVELEEAVAVNPDYDIRADIAQASYAYRRGGSIKLNLSEEASLILEAIENYFTKYVHNVKRGLREEEAYGRKVLAPNPPLALDNKSALPETAYERLSRFIQHYARGVKGVASSAQQTFVDKPSKMDLLRNAARGISGNARISPDTGRLFDVAIDTLDIGRLRDVAADAKKVVPEASVTLPRGGISFEGGGTRGSGKGWDRVIRTLNVHFPVIMAKLDAWTPQLRQRLREAKAELFSGIAALDDMGEPGRELRDILTRAVRLTKALENRSRLAFYGAKAAPGPAVAFEKFSRDQYKQYKERGGDEAFLFFQERMERQIWDFIEGNVMIDGPLLSVAKQWKEVWREEYRKNVHFMIELQKEMERQGYSLDIVNRKGRRKRWRPVSAEFGWSQRRKMFTKGRGRNIRYLTIDQAVDQMDQIWTPHFYPPRHWEQKVEEMEKRQAILDGLDPDTTDIPGFRHVNGGWQWMEGGEGARRPFFEDRDEAVAYARQQAAFSRSIAQEQLAALQSGSPREGHLERERETQDRFYEKRLALLVDMQMRFAQRAGELRFFGQFNPAKGKWGGSPILREYLARIREYAANDQEAALREFTRPLLGREKFAGLKGFDPDNPRTMFNSLLRWAKATRLKESESVVDSDLKADDAIDPNRVFEDNPELTEEMKATLVRIGLLRQNPDGRYRMRGFTAAGRILGEYFATVSLRENTAYNIFNGLNMKDSVDPVEVQGLNFWKALNDVTTIGTLGVTASVQNIAEMPIMQAMAGNKAAMKGLQQFITDPDFREAGVWLGASIGQTREYLSEGGEYTSRWLDFIKFNWTDKIGRGIGVLAGVNRVKEDMRAYVENSTAENAEKLRDYGVSQAVMDDFIKSDGTPGRLDQIFAEFDERYNSGLMPVEGVRVQGGEAAVDSWTDVLGDQIGRGAAFISDASFKQYNRLSLNSLLASRDPKIRVFLKYQAWAFQQSAHILRLTKRAFARAAKGDMRSLMWLVGTAGTLTGAYMGMRWVYDILQVKNEDKEVADRMINAFGEAQAAGYASMLMEIVRRSEGSSYEAMHSFMFHLSPPVGTFATRPLAEAVTAGGIIEGAGAGAKELVKQTPGGREARRFFGFVLPKDWR